MISNRCARKSLVTNCNSIISKNYLRFLVDSNDGVYILITKTMYGPGMKKAFPLLLIPLLCVWLN